MSVLSCNNLAAQTCKLHCDFTRASNLFKQYPQKFTQKFNILTLLTPRLFEKNICKLIVEELVYTKYRKPANLLALYFRRPYHIYIGKNFTGASMHTLAITKWRRRFFLL